MALAHRSLILTSVITRSVRSVVTQNARLCSLCVGSSDSLVRRLYLRNRQPELHLALPTCTTLYRSYAKAKKKDKPAKGGSGSKKAGESGEAREISMDQYKADLDTLHEELKQNLNQNANLRTNFASFDRLLIKTEDGNIPLNQIATITQKGPTFIMIDMPRSPQYVANVMEALQKSSMNLNPQQEKTHTVFVNIPKVSREHREKMAKGTKAMFNDTKEKMSKVYAKYLKQVNKHSGSKDHQEEMKDEILKEMKTAVNKAETMMKAKQQELLS